MKIKTDFVTNSSSSSFVVMGTYIEIDDIPEEKLTVVSAKLNCDLDELKRDRYELLEALLETTDLEFSFGDTDLFDDEPPAIGICYTKMLDDETLADFKSRIKSQILKYVGVEVDKVNHIEMCWENR